MKAVIQRVKRASVVINGAEERAIGPGLMILVGVAVGDTEEDARLLARKCAEVRIFEDEQGEIDNIFEDEVPYDLKAPVIQIAREDYGIWYVDMMEHPERYKGKTVEFTAKVLKPRSFPSKVFLPGRMAMTCCADDTTFLGYVCRSAYAPKLKAGQWITVRAKVRYANVSVYQGEGPVLEAENIEPAEPIEELVYFN